MYTGTGDGRWDRPSPCADWDARGVVEHVIGFHEVLVLRHFEGMCIEDVSRVLECQPGAAKHSVFRAVQKLRRALEPLVTAR